MIATYGRAAILHSIGFLAVWAIHAPSSTVPSTIATAEALHAAISDPVGDAQADPRIAISPDLASATADVADGNITFVIRFAPGTVDRSTTWVRVELDTDMSSATGNRERNGMGSDYTLLILANGTRASVQKSGYNSGGPCSSCVGDVAMTFAADAVRVSVPLSMLGNSDGHMLFMVKTWAAVDRVSPAGWDSMPNDDLPPGRI